MRLNKYLSLITTDCICISSKVLGSPHIQTRARLQTTTVSSSQVSEDGPLSLSTARLVLGAGRAVTRSPFPPISRGSGTVASNPISADIHRSVNLMSGYLDTNGFERNVSVCRLC